MESEQEFRMEYAAEFWDKRDLDGLGSLVEEYHKRCNEFDDALPKPYEMYRAESWKHAKEVDKELSEKARLLGFTYLEWQNARLREARYRRNRKSK